MKKDKHRQLKELIKNFSHHKMAMFGLIVVLIEVILVVVLPLIMDLDPYEIDKMAFKTAPNDIHILGTDELGRDMLARLIYGGRNSIMIGVSAMIISVLVGLPLGTLAGYYRGRVETFVMRSADIFQSFPAMVLILVVVAVFGSNVAIIIFLIGILRWPSTAKLIYGNVLSVRSKEFIEAERAIGSSDLKIIFKTVMPNSIAPLWVSLAFLTSSAMITESALSFLGAGIQPPEASWGNIIQAATNLAVLTQRWWIWIPAGSLLVITIVCINFVGEGLRDALDPKMKRI